MSADKAVQIFRRKFGREPEFVVRAPGRVNLIGDHTDYNEGFVFPAAIDSAVYVAAARTSGRSRFYSEERGDGPDFDAASLRKGELDGWMAYSAGMAWSLRENGHPVRSNLEAASCSTVPIGSGVSSSAAVEMAFGWLWNHFDSLQIQNKDLALIAQHCENHYVGVNCGIMDQMASAMGRQDHAMFLDTRTLDIDFAPVPDGVSIVLCDTGKSRSLAASDGYNQRRRQCERAAEILGVGFLRDANSTMLDQRREALGDETYRRALHVITENNRCQGFLQCLRSGQLDQAGDLMYESHASLRDDYEVSCRELDVMVEAAGKAGCIGARMTGAGFGGAVVALVNTPSVDRFIAETESEYRKGSKHKPAFLTCRAANGAGPLEST